MNPKALIAEFIATFALIFIGAGSIAVDHYTGGGTGIVGIALAHGLTIAAMVAATAAVSGAHINPAVTIALFVTKKIDSINAIGYIIAQCAGAIVGALAIKICVPAASVLAVNVGTPALAADVSIASGLITEIILTFFLMFVIYGSAVDKRGTPLAALFIGLTVTLDIFVGGPLTGAAMNPARHLGPAIVAGDFTNLWLYWVGPVIGAVLAALVYSNILEEA